MANLNDIKLSAQDILKKQFRSKVKGYDPDEVDAYLDEVISDYENFQQILYLHFSKVHCYNILRSSKNIFQNVL